jgi:hypothetical protein
VYNGQPKSPAPLRVDQRACAKCSGTDIDVNPAPGKSLQFWCNGCNHLWFEKHETRYAGLAAV